VVAVSLAATLAGWAALAGAEAQPVATAPTEPARVAAPAPPRAGGPTLAPLSDLQVLWSFVTSAATRHAVVVAGDNR
jgi:hypothetical protein